jgi:hypothetical protein
MKDFSKKEGQAMKKSIVLTIAAAAIFAACAKDTPIVESSEAIPATISVSIPADGLTKVELEQDSNPDGVVKLTWESTDAITVENAADDTKRVEFTYKSGAGTASAEFSAADISPLAGATSYNIYLTSSLPGGYMFQTQASDGDTGHLGYAATLSNVSKYDGATFSQTWASANGSGSFASSSVLRIRAQMPTAAIADAVQKITVKSSTPIFDGDSEMNITISSPGVGGDGKVVTAYATLPPGDVDIASGTELIFQFQVSDDATDRYTAYRKLSSAGHLYGGKVNFFKINCPDIESFAGPDDEGTAEHPYLIGDRHQMQAMHTLLGNDQTRYFKMVDDVDLTAINPWEPLCLDASENKKIYFDGANHTISHLTAGEAYNYPSFVGYLWGEIKNVIFDHATITCGSTKEQSAGVVAGYIGGSSHQGDLSGVTVSNSSVTSSGAFAGGIGARVGKSASVLNCHVINTTVSTTGTNVAGFLSYIASNCALTIADCSAERITVTASGHYAGGLVSQIASTNVTIRRCHTTGAINRTSSGRHFGGLVGCISSTGTQIINCYSTCSVTGYQFSGGLVGSFFTGGGGSIEHCMASGDITDKGNSGDGGLVGSVYVSGVTITDCIAWNGSIAPNKYASGNYSSGAVVGYTHPETIVENNYRRPGMSLTAYWVPAADFDHPNSSGGKMWIINDGFADGAYTTATGFTTPNGIWAYHGKHLPAGAVVEPDDNYGWVSDDVPGSSDPDPEDPAWSGDPTIDLVALGGTKRTLSPGVEWTTFEGTWEGAKRNINVIKTTLNATNHLGVYYNYKEEGYKYLDEKCEYLNAVAGTNGSMACCQFTRVDDVVKHGVTDASYYTSNCALTIDGDNVRIVKTDGNTGAAMLPNRTVTCAGPLLVWKGNIQTYTEEGSEDFLANTHPRTAIGLSKDNQTVIQVTVDGRWTSRGVTGMSTALLSQLMKGLGCYKAMNFDGGGGTQMWVDGYGDIHNIVNHPHNEWPTYGCGSGKYYWIKENEVARRTCGSAVYVYTD